MTILFSGQVSFPSGVTESSIFPVPNGIKSAQASMPADPVPLGTLVLIFLSYDGGLTFPRSGGFTRPISFHERDTSHIWPIRFMTEVQPTHAKVQVTAPSAFTGILTVEAP